MPPGGARLTDRLRAAFSRRRRRWIAVQHRLDDFNGHRANEVITVRREARRRGYEAFVLVHETAGPAVLRATGGRALLHDPAFRPDWSFDRRGDDFAAMLERFVAPLARRDDLVLVTTATQCELLGCVRWLAGRSESRAPSVAVVFPSDRWNRAGADREAALAEFASLADEVRLLEVRRARRLLIYAATPGLAAELASLLAVPVDAAVGALDYDIFPLPEARRALPERPRILVAGGARMEKGSLLLGEIVARCRQTLPVEFTVQLMNEQLPAEEFRRLSAAVLELGARGVEGALEPHAYAELFVDADLVLLPYERLPYRQRQSGPFLEAAACAIPAVVPDGTWMAEQVASGLAAGVCFPALEVGAVVAALSDAVRGYADLRRRALSLAEPFRRRHSLVGFLDQIEADVAARGSSPAQS